ncbi:hypothetical protein X794_04605 [Dehalococcoides mccartyi CG5]|nr:hypothetical protein X794_04605 [Dehalococcoides mccartyi CG5]
MLQPGFAPLPEKHYLSLSIIFTFLLLPHISKNAFPGDIFKYIYTASIINLPQGFLIKQR